MENVKESLEKFVEWYNHFHRNDSIELITNHEVEMFLNSRPREPEAINRNEHTQELCRCLIKSHYLLNNIKICVICGGVQK
jgi:hypothetical protein